MIKQHLRVLHQSFDKFKQEYEEIRLGPGESISSKELSNMQELSYWILGTMEERDIDVIDKYILQVMDRKARPVPVQG